MPAFSPEQLQFIGWLCVTGGGTLLAALVILRKLGFDISLPKRNGAPPAPAQPVLVATQPVPAQPVPAQVPGNGQIQNLSNKIDNLSGDHGRHGVILGKLADARVESKVLLKQVVDATTAQTTATTELTTLLRERLPER